MLEVLDLVLDDPDVHTGLERRIRAGVVAKCVPNLALSSTIEASSSCGSFEGNGREEVDEGINWALDISLPECFMCTRQPCGDLGGHEAAHQCKGR